jgi:hypothetical protein
LLVVALAAAGPARATVLLRPQYRVQAAIEPAAPQIEGSVTVSFTNSSPRALDEAVFLLFPNRFSEPDKGLNDFSRSLLYPDQEFDPGGLELLEVL